MRRFWLFGIVLVAAAGIGVWRLTLLPQFYLSSLSVTGIERVSRDDVVARAAIDRHANVWLLDRRAIARRIESIPYVLTAHVDVRPPAAVNIAVTERTIDGCVRDASGRSVTVDASDRILEDGCSGDSPVTYDVRVPIVATPGQTVSSPAVAQLQSDRRTLDPRGMVYRSYELDTFGQLRATLRDGVVVEYGDDDDLDGKSRLVAPILAQVAVDGRPVEAVDLRAERTPVVVYAPASPPPAHPIHRL